MLPMLTRVISDEKKWATEEELLNYYAIAQCTPGVIAVNTATFIGAKQKGTSGAVFATLGVIFPGAVIIMLIAAFLNSFADNQTVQNAFTGIRIAVCALVTVSVFRLTVKSVTGVLTAIIAVLAFAGTAFLGVSPAVIVPAAGVFGAVRAMVIREGKAGK